MGEDVSLMLGRACGDAANRFRELAGENRIYAVDKNGQLLSYGDAGTPGNVSNPVVVGFGGWLQFKQLFAGRNQPGQNRIYAVAG